MPSPPMTGWSNTPQYYHPHFERVANGQDEIRLMSWNNGAMASSTEEEFAESVRRRI